MSFLSRLFKRFPPREQLVVDVANELKRRGLTGGSYDHQGYAITVGSATIGLNNLFLEWRLLGRRDKASLVKRWLDATLDGLKPSPLGSYGQVAEKLVPLVRSRPDICLKLLNNQSVGAPAGNSAETAWAPFVGDLVTAVGIDDKNGIASVLRANLDHLGVGLDAAFQRALDNFRKQAPRLVFVEIGQGLPRGVFHSESASDYQSSMLLLPDRFPHLPEESGDPIVSVPGRNSMWMTGSRNEAAISALLDIGEKSLNSVHHRCSTELLRLQTGTWTPFVPDSNEHLRNKYQALLKKQEAVNYGQQTALLNKLLQMRGEDIYVGQSNLLVNGDHTKSWTAWASHADSMLPRADFIVLVEQIVDPSSGRATGSRGSIEVAWNEAFPFVHDLMEEVADIYPPRYRVRRFPDGATLSQLERRGIRHPGKPSKPAS